MANTTAIGEDLARIEGRPIVVSVSGGKDSTATALLILRELNLDHVSLVHAETGWEAGSHDDYLGYLEQMLGAEIARVRSEKGMMVDLVRRKAMFPSRVRRFCTTELKVIPIRDHLRLFADPVNAIGIRAAESAARRMYGRWDRVAETNGDVWRPILEWSSRDVVEIHRRHGIKLNPLYGQGASRVGCWPCIYARKADIRLIADSDPGRISQIAKLEFEITAAADARAAARGESNKNPRTWFCGRGPGSLGGRDGAMPIHEVVRWSRTSRGGIQFEMFAPLAGEHPCAKWGYCETWETDNG